MIYPVFSYRDTKVGFMPPVCDQSEAAAIRGFSFAINSENSIMGFSPKDFDLYQVGEFDTETGVLTSIVPVQIASGIGVFNGKKD